MFFFSPLPHLFPPSLSLLPSKPSLPSSFALPSHHVLSFICFNYFRPPHTIPPPFHSSKRPNAFTPYFHSIHPFLTPAPPPTSTPPTPQSLPFPPPASSHLSVTLWLLVWACGPACLTEFCMRGLSNFYSDSKKRIRTSYQSKSSLPHQG